MRSLQAGSYKEPLEVYEDLSLVFLNALYYNEPTSQIYKDAETLKVYRGFLYFRSVSDPISLLDPVRE